MDGSVCGHPLRFLCCPFAAEKKSSHPLSRPLPLSVTGGMGAADRAAAGARAAALSIARAPRVVPAEFHCLVLSRHVSLQPRRAIRLTRTNVDDCGTAHIRPTLHSITRLSSQAHLETPHHVITQGSTIRSVCRCALVWRLCAALRLLAIGQRRRAGGMCDDV
jgi:hypothetical protein